MHHPTDRITDTTAFVAPVVEHWLEREVAQWVHYEGSIRRPIANALTTELYLAPNKQTDRQTDTHISFLPFQPGGIGRSCWNSSTVRSSNRNGKRGTGFTLFCNVFCGEINLKVCEFIKEIQTYNFKWLS